MKPLEEAWQRLAARMHASGLFSQQEIIRARLFFYWGARAALCSANDHESALAICDEVIAFDDSIPGMKRMKARLDG